MAPKPGSRLKGRTSTLPEDVQRTIRAMLNDDEGESAIARHLGIALHKVRTVRLNMQGKTNHDTDTSDVRPLGGRRRRWFRIEGWWWCPETESFHMDNGSDDPDWQFEGICECVRHFRAAVWRDPDDTVTGLG